MRERLKVDLKDRPVSSRQLTTLRIKSETGDHTYVLKMRFTDTIRDVRGCLNAERKGESTNYEIISTFPRQTYNDDNVTLQDCGLVPSAMLILKPKKK
ncbi:hypothetical protein LSAT2_010065 [Lamellibrachia satsuma]|nr:hypothetical protein LSAT2_010065 [Lamellibrachia satsuma]